MAAKAARASVVPLTAPMPAPPTRTYSFTDWQVNNPTAPPPGDKLDSNFDLVNQAITQTINWASVSLNTDGTLRDGTVGQSNLVPGLFDGISQDVIEDVQPLVDEAQSYATNAQTSANSANSSAAAAAASAGGAANSCHTSTAAAQAAIAAQAGAQAAETSAQNDAIDAQNAANDAAGAQGECSAYADVANAWAEYMPNTIPPNILAVMGITGDHWSSRWWANQASQIVQDAENTLDLALQYALTQIAQATAYAVATIQAAARGASSEYRYKPAAGVTVLTGADLSNNTLIIDATQDSVWVFKGGTRIYPPTDFTIQENQITLIVPADGNTTYTVDVAKPAGAASGTISSIKLNVAGWAPDGAKVTFPLINTLSVAVVPQSVTDVLFSLDGVWLEATKDFTVAGSTITFTAAPKADSNMFGIVGIVGVVGRVTVKFDVSSWAPNGSTVTFPLLDAVAAPIKPPKTSDVLFSIDGVWLEAGKDFTISGSNIVFAVAPQADSDMFGIASVPAGGGP